MKVEKGYSKLDLGVSSKKLEKANIEKFEIKETGAKSIEALGSYGRAFVNLSKNASKTSFENSWLQEPFSFSEEEKSALIKLSVEPYRVQGPLLDEILDKHYNVNDDDLSSRKLSIVKLLEDNARYSSFNFILGLGDWRIQDKGARLNFTSFAYELLLNEKGISLGEVQNFLDDFNLETDDSDRLNSEIDFSRNMLKIGLDSSSAKELLLFSKKSSKDTIKMINNSISEISQYSFDLKTMSQVLEELLSCDDQDVLKEKIALVSNFASKCKENPDNMFPFQLPSILYDGRIVNKNTQLLKAQLSNSMLNKGVDSFDIDRIFDKIHWFNDDNLDSLQCLILNSALEENQKPDDIIKFVSAISKKSNNMNASQMEFAYDLLRRKFSTYDIVDVLSNTYSKDDDINQNQIAFVKEMLDFGVDIDDVISISAQTKFGSKESNVKKIELTRELLKEKVDFEAIYKIFNAMRSFDDNTHLENISFVKDTFKKVGKIEDLVEIMFSVDRLNKDLNSKQLALAKRLIEQNKSVDEIRALLISIKSYNGTIAQKQLDFAQELLDYGADISVISLIMSILAQFDEEENSSQIKKAKELLELVKSGEISFSQIPVLISNECPISLENILALNKSLGLEEVKKLSPEENALAASFSELFGVDDVNQIKLEDKKEIIRKMVFFNANMFCISDKLKKMFPLIPKTQEEYCSLLPSLVKSLGIETNKLDDKKIEEFFSHLSSLATTLKNIPDSEFDDLKIEQDCSKKDFIKDAYNILKDLSKEERQKVFDYFGFELYQNEKGTKIDEKSDLAFSIIGYPVNLNNGKKLSKIQSPKTKEVLETLRPYVIKFSEGNNISVFGSSFDQELSKELSEILSALPELQTTAGRSQHGMHSFDILKHSLKVMQKIIQNPDFEKLNESDKKLMLLASLLHDISKREGVRDKVHQDNSAFDGFYISKKFNLSKDEEIKLFSLIKNHEWLGYVNNPKINDFEKQKRRQSVAFDLQYDNLFDMSKIFTMADLKAVTKGENSFYKHFEDDYFTNCDIIQGLIEELKKTQPLLPVTKIPSASRIKSAITRVNSDGSTDLKGIYQDENGLIIIRFNEVENETWEKIGFDKGTISSGIETQTVYGDKIDTGNIHFFAHGLDYEFQLRNFDVFNLPDSDAMLSVSYVERPESKFRFFRTKGVILNADSKYVYGGGNTDSGSGCGKSIENFKNEYIFGAHRQKDRNYISDLIKKELSLNDEEYLEFVRKNKNKPFSKIEPKEASQKLIKAFAKINSSTRRGEREYNEMYISNPEVMAVFAYPMDIDNEIGNTLDFVRAQDEFLKKYALEHNIPMILFGK